LIGIYSLTTNSFYKIRFNSKKLYLSLSTFTGNTKLLAITKNIFYKARFLNLFFIISLPCLCASGQQIENTKKFVNPQAKILNDSAVSVMFHSPGL